MKFIGKLFTALLAFCALSVVLTGCTGPSEFIRKLNDVSFVEWVDDDNAIVLRQVYGGARGYGSICIDGETNQLAFMISDDVGGGGYIMSIFYEPEIFEGNTFESGKYATFYVEPDNEKEPHIIQSLDSEIYGPIEIYGKTFAQLTFEKRDIDRETVTANEFTNNIEWADDDGLLKIKDSGSFFFSVMEFTEGKAKINGKSENIKLSFVGKDKFELRRWSKSDEFWESTPLYSGSYVTELSGNDVPRVTLYFDEPFDGTVKELQLQGKLLK